VPFQPLSWSDVIHKVLLPEAVICLIVEDLPHLNRTGAIDTMKLSAHYGSVLHYNEDSPAVQDITKKLATTYARSNALYDKYESSQSSRSFNQWVHGMEKKSDSDAVIKVEEINSSGPNTHTSDDPEIIDLTIDE